MKFSISDAIAFGGLTLAIFSSIIGGIIWYANAEKKKYGLERDFNHLKRNQQQILDGLNSLVREIDRRFDSIDRDILEIKSSTKLTLPRQ